MAALAGGSFLLPSSVFTAEVRRPMQSPDRFPVFQQALAPVASRFHDWENAVSPGICLISPIRAPGFLVVGSLGTTVRPPQCGRVKRGLQRLEELESYSEGQPTSTTACGDKGA